jgi:hypothetical protein
VPWAYPVVAGGHGRRTIARMGEAVLKRNAIGVHGVVAMSLDEGLRWMRITTRPPA